MITITDKRHTRYFYDLKAGETFLAKGCHDDDILYIRLSGADLTAVNLENGAIVKFGYNDSVLPVEVEANIIR